MARRTELWGASVAAGAGGVAVVVGWGSMVSTISLIDRVFRRGLFFNKAPLREKKNNQ